MRILIIDNDDSFTRNLSHLLAGLPGARCEIRPCAEIGDGLDGESRPDLVVLSPGPGRPADYPMHAAVFDSGLPVMGICLGMQSLNEHFGGETAELSGCVHGRAEEIRLGGRSVAVARYHSLFASRIGEGLEVEARNGDGVVMALRHRTRPLAGYQFHPESFLTSDGRYCIELGLRMLGLG